MCFGNLQPTEQKQQLQNTQGSQNQQTQNTQTQNLPSWLTDAASANLGFAQNLQGAGFTPYSGEQVAGFSPQQQASFGQGGALGRSVMDAITSGFGPSSSGPTFSGGGGSYGGAGSTGSWSPTPWSGYGATPMTSGSGAYTGGGNYTGGIGGLAVNAATAGPASVTTNSIASQMSPYMNQYVQQALQPQLFAQNEQFNTQNKGFDSSATGAGAFGDTGWGLGRSTLAANQAMERAGLVGNAYNAAFNTAIGAGAQDVASKLAANTTNANLYETGLQRQLQGANQLYGLGSGVTNLNNSLGAQQTQQGQARLNAQYNQWLMGQQYPFQTIQAMNSAIQSGRTGAPISTTGTGSASGNSTGLNFGQSQTQAPNNAGYGLIGAGLGAAGTMLGGPIGGMIGQGIGGMFGPQGGGTGPNMPTQPAPNGSSWGIAPGGGYAPTYYADGGATQGGKPIIVGERGPEVFLPGQGGVVIPNEVLAAAREKRANKIGRPAVSGLAAQLGAVA